MADHCRKQIRDALVAYMQSFLVPATVALVSSARVHPLESDPLPAMLVLTPAESAAQLNKALDEARTLTVNLEVYAMGQSVQDDLDAIAIEAEPSARLALPTWVKTLNLKSTALTLSGEAVNPVGVLLLEFAVVYHTNPAAPDVPL